MEIERYRYRDINIEIEIYSIYKTGPTGLTQDPLTLQFAINKPDVVMISHESIAHYDAAGKIAVLVSDTRKHNFSRVYHSQIRF